jgi:hypothetical protein
VSPLLITALVVTGVVALVLLGYLNHVLENSKLEKARLKAELTDRLRRCEHLTHALPGQFITPSLKALLVRLQLHYQQRLLTLDKRNEELRQRIEETQALVAQGENIAVGNLPQKVSSEAIAKDLRFQLETLHSQLAHAVQINLLNANEARHWQQEIRHLLVLTHIELFLNLGQQALHQQHAGQARLAFERGVQYLRKQPDLQRYQSQLAQLERQLERANERVLQDVSSNKQQPSQLTEGLEALAEDEWKKTNLYD